MIVEQKETIIRRYQERLAEYGPGIKALASGTEHRRKIRFDVLSDVGIENGCSVLDVGCGFADYYTYLKEQGLNIQYTGVDIVDDLITHAKSNHPHLDLQVRDIQENPFPEQSYDFVTASQVFNYKFGEEENLNFVTDMLKIMFRFAKRAVAVDFITSYVDFKEDHLNYYSPEKMFGIGKSITKRVTLRHDYPLFEFCLYFYPDFSGWKK